MGLAAPCAISASARHLVKSTYVFKQCLCDFAPALLHAAKLIQCFMTTLCLPWLVLAVLVRFRDRDGSVT